MRPTETATTTPEDLRMDVATPRFTITPIAGSHVFEVARATSGGFIGLVRELPDCFRAHGLDGWESFPTMLAAVAAIVRRLEVLGG